MTVEEIKAAIPSLTLDERAEIIAELSAWTDDDWDRQMKGDAAAGKFDALNREADADRTAGNYPRTDGLCELPSPNKFTKPRHD